MTTQGTIAKEVIEGTREEARAVFGMCKKNNVHVKLLAMPLLAPTRIEFTSHNWLALQRCVNAVKRKRQESLEQAAKANLRKFAR